MVSHNPWRITKERHYAVEGVRQETLVPVDRYAIFIQQIFFQYAAVTKQLKVRGIKFCTIFLAGDIAWAELTG